jgi:hypothetical protein
MANESLPSGYLKAGADYLKALRTLGLEPEALLWAKDRTINEFALVLITSHFDFKGPREIYRLLTLAYNRAATPATISPFIIRLHSPRQVISQQILESEWSTSGTFAIMTLNRGDLTYQDKWIYTAKYKKGAVKVRRLNSVERSKQWNKFKSNVERLAA